MPPFYSRKIVFFFFLLIAAGNFLSAQITVDDADFADANDTARMSEAVWNPFLDFGATDTNYTWDFSDLQWQSQFVDTFRSTLFMGSLYSLTFSNIPFNPYRSNIAVRGDNILTNIPLVSALFTNGYNFYYKTQSLYRQKGIGVSISGVATPAPMAHADTLFHFPMNYGDEDSSNSDYTLRIQQLATVQHTQFRKNKVDGWGTLITPFGTFPVLRHVTEILGSDSLYLDTLNFGFKLDNDIKREYKWIGKNQKEPLLTIFTQAGILGQFQNFEFVTKIIYRDSVRFAPVGIFEAGENEIQFSVFPNPSNGIFYIAVPENLTRATLTLTDMNGKLLLTREMHSSYDALDLSEFSKGIYLLTLQSTAGRAQKKLVVQ